MTTPAEPIELTLRNPDIAEGRAIDVVFWPGRAGFNDADHAKNFVKYLFRAGSEKPNERTVGNKAWMNSNLDGVPADGDSGASTRWCRRYQELLADNYETLTNGLVYFLARTEAGEIDETVVLSSDEIFAMLTHIVHDHLQTPLFSENVLYVSHLDQDDPAHIHYVTRADEPDLYERIFAQAMAAQQGQ